MSDLTGNALSPKAGKTQWPKVFSILIPVTIQHMLSFGLNIVDTLMVGRVGTDALAAVGAANQVYSLFSIVCFGILTAGGVFISQYWGIRDIKSIRHVLGIIYKYNIIICVVFTILVEIIPGQLIWLFVREEPVIALGIDYFRIVAVSYIITALSFCMSFSSRCIQRLKYPTLINACAIAINSVLNYIMIYGKLGLPAMGVKGAALATLIARVIEFSLLVFYIYKARNHPLAAKLSEMKGYTAEFRNHILVTAWPIVLSDGAWGLGATVFLGCYGVIGSVAVAAYQVVNIIGEFCQSIFYGLGNASSVVLGEELGSGDVAQADKDAKAFLWIGLGTGLLLMLILWYVNPFVAGWYKFDAETTAVLNPALAASMVTIAGRAICYLLMCGILRSGGDTKVPAIIDMSWTWVFGVVLTLVGVNFLGFTLAQALFIRYISECAKALMLYMRYRTKKWENVLTDVVSDN